MRGLSFPAVAFLTSVAVLSHLSEAFSGQVEKRLQALEDVTLIYDDSLSRRHRTTDAERGEAEGSGVIIEYAVDLKIDRSGIFFMGD